MSDFDARTGFNALHNAESADPMDRQTYLLLDVSPDILAAPLAADIGIHWCNPFLCILYWGRHLSLCAHNSKAGTRLGDQCNVKSLPKSDEDVDSLQCCGSCGRYLTSRITVFRSV